tara:strand:- start:395 stop:643 length:249 start_codon:yes stop_codon:yes gene_type:complete
MILLKWNIKIMSFWVTEGESYMEDLTALQNQYVYFTDMLKSIEKIKNKTPGNGFAKMKCKEKIAELEAIFDKIDYAAQITYD